MNARAPLPFRREPQRLFPIARAHDLVAGALEPERDELEDVRVVVGGQDERARERECCRHAAIRSRSRGSSTRKVVPTPGTLRKVMDPSCASTIALTIVSPSPVPWIARSVAAVVL